MAKNTKARIQKHRRANKAWLRVNRRSLWGSKKNYKLVARKHIRIGGRTGQIHSKQTPSKKRFEYHTLKPNPPFTGWMQAP